MSAKNEVRLLGLDDGGKENVEAVAELLTKQNIKNVWLDSSQVVATSTYEEDVIYVVDPTQGKEVDHLVALGFSVIGPQCALTVLKHNILLRKDLQYPVYNLTMLGCLICFSNIEPARRAELRRKVERMGGKVTGSLTQDVSHLVVKEVGSVKYFSAAHVGIAIMTSDWIEHLWKHGQSRYISAKDGKWAEFRCPVFLGCSVCVTGFSTAERSRIQKLVTKFGGTYSGAMKLDITTHLVVHKPEGQKYEMAHKFGVKVVSVEWVQKSVEKGSCLDHRKFPVRVADSVADSKPNSSTPERCDVNMPKLNDLSNISVMTVNETVTASMADVSVLSSINAPLPPSKTAKADLLNFPLASCQEQILDGISVFTAGFSIKEEERLHQLLIKAGATRCKQLTLVVSHVMVGSPSSLSDNLLTSVQAAAARPGVELWIVSYKWLLDSLRIGELLSEYDYWVDAIAPKPRHVDEHVVDNAEQSTCIQAERPAKDTMKPVSPPRLAVDPLLSQYMDGDTTLLRNFDMDDAQEGVAEQEVESAVGEPLNDSRWTFMRGLSFLLVGFEEEEHNRCVEYIESHGGHLLAAHSKKVADYAVVPITGFPLDRTATHVVTDFWLDSCLTEGKLLSPDFHPMAAPFSLRDVTPLDGCVTSLSKYQEPERSHLVALMKELGAVYQDNVARKDMPPLRRTTHLIVLAPEGDKYVGCKKWGIPTVTAEWVFACARRGVRLAEADFLVDKEDEQDKLGVVADLEPEKVIERVARDRETPDKAVHNMRPPDTSPPQHHTSDFPPMPRAPNPEVDEILRRLDARAKAQKLPETAPATPYREKVLKIMGTPSGFFDPNINVSFELDEVFALLKTPNHVREKIKASIKPETPLSDIVERFLKDALKDLPDCDDEIVKNLEKLFDSPDEGCQRTAAEEAHKSPMPSARQSDEKPLKGVVLYVCKATCLKMCLAKMRFVHLRSWGHLLLKRWTPNMEIKKLSRSRMDAQRQVNELGGEFRWTYDDACTHFVFQGKPNDVNREFRTARLHGKFIVSPHWLDACHEAGERVDESGFPHDYNPNKSIQIVPVASQNRSKRLRSSTQSSQASTRTTRSSARLSSAESGKVEKEGRKTSKKEDNESTKASQEARESLRKTVESLISSTEKLKSAKPRTSGGKSGSYSSPTYLPPPRATSKPPPPIKMTSDSEKPESSQDVHVVWDDPIGRQEMERIMREEEVGGESTNQKAPRENEQRVEADPDGTAAAAQEDDHRLSQILRDGGIPAFLISSISPEQKVEYAAVVERLGGTYLNRDYFDPQTSHLIVRKPARNEKFLASLASGKWILHTDYIEACREAGAFVREDAYEYGNPLNAWKPANEAEAALSAAAYRWRRSLHQKRVEKNESVGAFAGWKVLLLVSPRHTPGFIRLLQSGLGRVVGRSIPFQGDVGSLTHAIIDPNRLKELPGDHLAELCRAGVHCCVSEYLADFLMKDPPPLVEDSYLPAAKQLLDNDHVKRRRIDHA